MEKLIEARDLWYRYSQEGDWALRGASLDISRGEFIGLIGESGAGKTTLAKHLNGLLKPRRGFVKVLGMDTRKTPASRISRHVGYVFQNPDSQIYAATIYDEIASGLKRLGYGKEEIIARIEYALKAVDLRKPLTYSPHVLSFGERHRLAIATVLAINPDVIILDEPFAGIDYRRSLQMLEILKKLVGEGHSVLLIAHDLQLMGEVADRVIVMKQGSIIRDGDVEEVLGDIGFLEENGYIPLQVTIVGMKSGIGRYIRVEDMAKEIIDRIKKDR
ncbi:MAG: ABC transporter ATP-binding protein [Desulfurococcales archaeon]|jgi:energy-coupling factor transport system ATP-binding protein|nr:ABC transporter ATP-binding protein [Desulfurococcales archaeon]